MAYIFFMQVLLNKAGDQIPCLRVNNVGGNNSLEIKNFINTRYVGNRLSNPLES